MLIFRPALCALVGVVLLLANCAWADLPPFGVQSLAITPSSGNATPSDPLAIQIAGTSGTSFVPQFAWVDGVFANDVYLTIGSTLGRPWDVFAQVLTPWSKNTALDPLPVGTYDFYVEGIAAYGSPYQHSLGISLILENFVVSEPVGMLGDVDGNSELTAADIDALHDLIDADDPRGDLNNDNATNYGDLDYLVGSIFDTTYGDANLNGSVDGDDFDAWRLRDSLGGGRGWATGDFDGDADFDGHDLDMWRWRANSYGYDGGDSHLVASVPEPTGLALLAIGLVVFAVRRGR